MQEAFEFFNPDELEIDPRLAWKHSSRVPARVLLAKPLVRRRGKESFSFWDLPPN